MTAEQIERHFINQYSTNILYLAQQKGSKLRGTVMNEVCRGEQMFWDQYGKREMLPRNTRFADSPVNPNPRESRRLVPEAFHDGDFVDSFDAVRMLNSPEAPLVKQMAAAAGRKIDDVIIKAALGTAQVGRKTITNVNLDPARTIAVNDHNFDSGSGNVGLTPGKLRSARALYGQADVDVSEMPMHVVCTQYQIENMLSTVEATSADYVNIKALINGEVNSFLNYQFHIVSPTLLPINAGVRTVLTYRSDAIVLAMSKEPTGNIEKRADKSFNWYAYFEMFLGATRVEEAKVVPIMCLEA